jgi:hypothetical protein
MTTAGIPQAHGFELGSSVSISPTCELAQGLCQVSLHKYSQPRSVVVPIDSFGSPSIDTSGTTLRTWNGNAGLLLRAKTFQRGSAKRSL